MSRKSYTLDCLTKVEGHAKLNVVMDGKSVKKAEIEVYEPSRYFEHMAVGKSYDILPSVSQRICGICSVVHTVTSVKAVENAIGVVPSQQTEDLRRLLLHASTIHSHTAHLFFFAAPDYLGVSDAIEMARKRRAQMELAIKLQEVSSGIVKEIGGRSLHPVTARVGHFTSAPGRSDVERLIGRFEELERLSEEAARLFMSFRYPDFENRTAHVSLRSGGEYPFYDGEVAPFGGEPFPAEGYASRIAEETIFRSTAKYARIDGRPYMTGALARMNNNHERLSRKAKLLLGQSGMRMPCFNTFRNNVAQAIEMVHCAEAAAEILRGYSGSGMRMEKPEIKPMEGEGVAACEAPRGTLYHHYRFGRDGRCTFANIMTPTCQNVLNMESDMGVLLPKVIGGNDGKVKRSLEMLIRAYDPCFSCSTHFLELELKR